MKKKDLIFYAGAAVLMVYLLRESVQMSWFQMRPLLLKATKSKLKKAPEVAVAEKSVAPVASNYAAPANVTEPAVVPVSKTTASESVTPSVEKTTEASTTEKDETPLLSDTGRTTFL